MSVYLVYFSNKSCFSCLADSIESAITKCKFISDCEIVKVELVPLKFVE